MSPLSLSLPPQSNDLLWDDYEAKLADQALRLMENYLAQFGDFKVRPCAVGRGWGQGEHGEGGLAHLSAPRPGAHRQAGPKARGLRQRPAPPGGPAERQEKGRGQNRQGWDSPGRPGTAPAWGQSPGRGDKATAPPVSPPQAEEEFNKAQAVFEDLNSDLREELPVLYGRCGAVTGLGTSRGLGDI